MSIKRFGVVDGQIVECAEGAMIKLEDFQELQKKYGALLVTVDAFSKRGCHHDLEPTRLYKSVDTVEQCMIQEHQFYSGYMKSMDSMVRTSAQDTLKKVGATPAEIAEAEEASYKLLSGR